MIQAATQVPAVLVVLTSAAVGAFVSSIVALVGAHMERRARRRELLLREALTLAHQRTELVMRVVEKTGQHAEIQDAVYIAEQYYQWLVSLLDKGELPPEAKQRLDAAKAKGNQRRQMHERLLKEE